MCYVLLDNKHTQTETQLSISHIGIQITLLVENSGTQHQARGRLVRQGNRIWYQHVQFTVSKSHICTMRKLNLHALWSPREWLGGTFPKWPILDRVGCKNSTQSISENDCMKRTNRRGSNMAKARINAAFVSNSNWNCKWNYQLVLTKLEVIQEW